MSDTSLHEARVRLSNMLAMPIDLRVLFDSRGKTLVARPTIMPKRHGFSFSCRRPYKGVAIAELELDSYGSDIVELWNARGLENAKVAFEYLGNLSFKPNVTFRVNGQNVSDQMSLERLASTKWDPSQVSLKVVVRQDDLPEIELSTVEAALGFALLLAGYQGEREEPDQLSNNALEGDITKGLTTRHERSWANRMRCLAYHGTDCAVCGFSFGKTYGKEYEGMIEVHHITPLSSLDGPVVIDPKKDLVPLCPNCHRAIHRANPPLLPDELKQLIKERAK